MTGKMFELDFVKKLFDGETVKIVYQYIPFLKKKSEPVQNKHLPGRRIKKSIINKKPDQIIYSWVDKNGVKHFSDTPPPDGLGNYETKKAVVSNTGGEITTSVIINGNRILVPVKLSYNGRLDSTWLQLDTGASTTVIHHPVANHLNMSGSRWVKNTIADGSVIDSRQGRVDHILVGPYKIENFLVTIIDYKGRNALSEGLLGMNFLKNVDYKINFDRQTISWVRK